MPFGATAARASTYVGRSTIGTGVPHVRPPSVERATTASAGPAVASANSWRVPAVSTSAKNASSVPSARTTVSTPERHRRGAVRRGSANPSCGHHRRCARRRRRQTETRRSARRAPRHGLDRADLRSRRSGSGCPWPRRRCRRESAHQPRSHHRRPTPRRGCLDRVPVPRRRRGPRSKRSHRGRRRSSRRRRSRERCRCNGTSRRRSSAPRWLRRPARSR